MLCFPRSSSHADTSAPGMATRRMLWRISGKGILAFLIPVHCFQRAISAITQLSTIADPTNSAKQ